MSQMSQIESFMRQALLKRKENHLLRSLSLPTQESNIDFSSNDYLGLAREKNLHVIAEQIFQEYYPSSKHYVGNGSSGSRLLSGNYRLIEDCEKKAALFHKAEAALFYNSGYDANLGLLSALASRDDIIVYDQWIHASLRDGIVLSKAKNFSYKHNDLDEVHKKLQQATQLIKQKNSKENSLSASTGETKNKIFLVSESVFSMDGDSPDLEALTNLCQEFSASLIIDEAHAGGIFQQGRGMLCKNDLQKKTFARVITFGKAAGLHGAVVLGSSLLREFLINFSRPFIYSTAPSPRHLAYIFAFYRWLESESAHEKQKKLMTNIDFFVQQKEEFSSRLIANDCYWLASESSIQSFVVPGNQRARKLASFLRKNSFSLFPVLSPTVSAGSERLRVCLHVFNSRSEIEKFFLVLKFFFQEEASS